MSRGNAAVIPGTENMCRKKPSPNDVMGAYDILPAEVRRIVRNSAFDMDVGRIVAVMRKGLTVAEIVARLQTAEALLLDECARELEGRAS